MNDRDRRMIKSIAANTGVGVSLVTKSLKEFREYGYEPTPMELVEYLRLRGSAVAFYKIDKETGNRTRFSTKDYIKAIMRSDK